MYPVSSNPDRGSVIVADLVIGAAIVLILAAAASAVGIVIDAGQSSREAARSAAVELARGESANSALSRAKALAPAGATISHEFLTRSARVSVEATVSLPHPVFLERRVTLGSVAVVPIAPYRSGP
jgi:hypothetical protein